MKRFKAVLIPATLLCLAVQPASAAHHEATAEEVIAKHIEAKGGRDAWNAIDSLKLTGEFTSFSKISPFTNLRGTMQVFRMLRRERFDPITDRL